MEIKKAPDKAMYLKQHVGTAKYKEQKIYLSQSIQEKFKNSALST